MTFIGVRLLRNVIRQVLNEAMFQRTPGWWVLKDGSIIDVKDPEEHADVAARIYGLDPDGRIDPCAIMYAEGCISIRFFKTFCGIQLRSLDHDSFRRLQNAIETVAGDKLTTNCIIEIAANNVTLRAQIGDIIAANNPRELMEFSTTSV